MFSCLLKHLSKLSFKVFFKTTFYVLLSIVFNVKLNIYC
jgi:hypothetical protein